jgi:hypothetical protein
MLTGWALAHPGLRTATQANAKGNRREARRVRPHVALRGIPARGGRIVNRGESEVPAGPDSPCVRRDLLRRNGY